jgi:uncharacterized protein YegP (UPF0339 family)
MPNKKGSKKNPYWAKVRFEIEHNPKMKQSYHWRARSCNGRIICSAERFTSNQGPIKTIKSFIDAIQKGQFRIDEIESDKR